jgi:hypothetical protein
VSILNTTKRWPLAAGQTVFQHHNLSAFGVRSKELREALSLVREIARQQSCQQLWRNAPPGLGLGREGFSRFKSKANIEHPTLHAEYSNAARRNASAFRNSPELNCLSRPATDVGYPAIICRRKVF